MKLLLILISILLLIAGTSIAGLVFSKTVTPTTAGVVVDIKDKYETTQIMDHYVTCSADDFVVTAWRWSSGSWSLVQNNSAYSDTTTATGLAGMIIPFRGTIDRFVVTPVAVSGAAINIQSYTLE